MAESKIISVLDQQTVADQFIGDERIIDQGHQQLRLHPGTNQCRRIERLPRRRTQRPGPGEDSIANRRRQAVVASLQHLGNEERIAGGQPMQLGCVDLRAMHQCCNAGCGERWQAEPAGRSLARQPAQGEPQLVIRHKGVVAIGDQQERPQVLDPSAEVAQQIQRCLISPVDVLDGNNGKSFQAVELTQQCPHTAGPVSSQPGKAGAAHPPIERRYRGEARVRRV
jgi:hypothetical protein